MTDDQWQGIEHLGTNATEVWNDYITMYKRTNGACEHCLEPQQRRLRRYFPCLLKALQAAVRALANPEDDDD